MGTIRIRPEADCRPSFQEAFARHRGQVLELIPGAEIEHVGATSVPGALTKGDVDLLVRVQQADLSGAIAALRNAYAVHQPENWTPRYASFTDPREQEPPVGVQVAVRGSAEDGLFGPFRDALIADPALLAEYNALKLRCDGQQYEEYTATKGAFVERVLEELDRPPAA